MNDNTILKSAKVREIIQNKRRLVDVPHTASVADTLNALLANNILAVPVAAPLGQWIGAGGSMILESDKLTGSVRKQYIRMVSMLDILLHVVECVAGTDIEANLMSVPVSAIIGRSLEGLSLWSINPDTSGIESDSWGRHVGEQKLGRCEKKQLPSSRIIVTASEAQPAQWEEDSENSNEDFDISSSNFRYTDIGFHFRFFHHFHLPQLSSRDIDNTDLEDPLGPKASSCVRSAMGSHTFINQYLCLCLGICFESA